MEENHHSIEINCLRLLYNGQVNVKESVIKKNGRKSSFDRDKLSKSIYIALKKRPIDTETAEKFISKISRALEELGQSEISTNNIGTMVMEGLKELDPVAYVRFASVYRNFREEKDFVQFVDKLDVYKKR